MFGIGGFELFLILIFGFLIFGPEKLPAIAKTIGKAIAKFRDAQEEMTGRLNKESFIDKDSDEPFKNPLDVLEQATKDARSNSKKVRASVHDIAQDAKDTFKDESHPNGDVSTGDNMSEDASENTRATSFAERKAEYDRQRKARKEAEMKAKEASDTHQGDEGKEDPKRDTPKRTPKDASDGNMSAAEDASSDTAEHDGSSTEDASLAIDAEHARVVE